jgi:hypothetical protein
MRLGLPVKRDSEWAMKLFALNVLNTLNTAAAPKLRQFVLCLAAAFFYAAANAQDVSHEVGRIKTKELVETSGLAASRHNPEVLWLHNDGSSGRVFAVSPTGKLVALVTCRAKFDDFEDIAIGPGPKRDVDYLYLGDIGDNSSRRSEIRVVRFAEPDLSGERGQELTIDDAETFRLTYPDSSHNAEALLVDPVRNELCIVTKEKKRARLYCVAIGQLKQESVAKLALTATLNVEYISAGTISADGRQILLRWEKEGWLWNREKSESVADALSKKPKRVPVLGKDQAHNGESIDFSPSGDEYYTVSEGKKQAIYVFDLPKTTSD